MGNLGKFLKRTRKITLPLAFVTFLSSPFIGYGVQQKKSEYRTLQTIERILEEKGANTNSNLALIMGMVRKESSFYGEAIGRDSEVGLMQLTPPVALEKGLRVFEGEIEEPSNLGKLLYLNQSSTIEDDRLDPEKSLRAGSEYLFDLVENFQRRYGMDRPTSIQFGMIAYNFGQGNVNKLFRMGYSRNPEEFIERLSEEDLSQQGISDRKRVVVVDYFNRTNRFRKDYERKIPGMLENGSPTFGEYVRGITHGASEIYQRVRN